MLTSTNTDASTAPATKLRNNLSNESPLASYSSDEIHGEKLSSVELTSPSQSISSNLHDGKSVGISRPALTSGPIAAGAKFPSCTE
ncbi:hypothetical protein FBULB1_5389 [Fusarium bulbicola]|nr:hypothetical protein FBULB1_5389 [Fusarium bulbicola]